MARTKGWKLSELGDDKDNKEKLIEYIKIKDWKDGNEDLINSLKVFILPIILNYL